MCYGGEKNIMAVINTTELTFNFENQDYETYTMREQLRKKNVFLIHITQYHFMQKFSAFITSLKIQNSTVFQIFTIS